MTHLQPFIYKVRILQNSPRKKCNLRSHQCDTIQVQALATVSYQASCYYTCAGSNWWPKNLGPCHLCSRPGWNVLLLALAWHSPGFCGHFWEETSEWKISLSPISPCRSAIQINMLVKIKFKDWCCDIASKTTACDAGSVPLLLCFRSGSLLLAWKSSGQWLRV